MTERGLILIWLVNTLFAVWCGLLFTLGGRDWRTPWVESCLKGRPNRFFWMMLKSGKSTRRFGIAVSIAVFFALRSAAISGLKLGILYLLILSTGYGTNSILKKFFKKEWLVRVVNGVVYGAAPLIALGVRTDVSGGLILAGHFLLCVIVNATVKADELHIPAAINEAYVGLGTTLLLPWLV